MHSQKINIFKYTDYRQFLEDYVNGYLKTYGTSYRKLAQKCNINSPCYFQKVLTGKRNITPHTALKITDGLEFSKEEAEYFMQLVLVSRMDQGIEKIAANKKLDSMRARVTKNKVTEGDFFSHWGYGIIYELVGSQDMVAQETIINAVNNLMTRQSTLEALKFLEQKKYINRTGSYYRVSKPLQFNTIDDKKRMLDVQRNHEYFLNQAKLRLIDDLNKREFQGLTIAIPAKEFYKVKDALRKTIQEINEEFSEKPACDSVIQVELASFFLVDPESVKPSNKSTIRSRYISEATAG